MGEMNFYRILVVEDEQKLLQHLSEVFRNEGFSTFTCSNYKELENIFELSLGQFDVVVLDRLLGGHDSVNLVGKIKKAIPATKIMILSAINSSAEKVNLLDLGADDYLAKPFDSQELVARVRALLRREQVNLQIGNVTLDSVERTIRINGSEMPLSNKEFVLLRTLAKSPGKVFNKTFLYEHVWGMSADVESNVVETTVNKLRRKLKDSGGSIQIKNARFIGYWIEE